MCVCVCVCACMYTANCGLPLNAKTVRIATDEFRRCDNNKYTCVYTCILIYILDSRAGRGIPKMPVELPSEISRAVGWDCRRLA